MFGAERSSAFDGGSVAANRRSLCKVSDLLIRVSWQYSDVYIGLCNISRRRGSEDFNIVNSEDALLVRVMNFGIVLWFFGSAPRWGAAALHWCPYRRYLNKNTKLFVIWSGLRNSFLGNSFREGKT